MHLGLGTDLPQSALFRPRSAWPGAVSGEKELRDLDGVQRCALAQIVIAHE